jgi:hypothetical protein
VGRLAKATRTNSSWIIDTQVLHTQGIQEYKRILIRCVKRERFRSAKGFSRSVGVMKPRVCVSGMCLEGRICSDWKRRRVWV